MTKRKKCTSVFTALALGLCAGIGGSIISVAAEAKAQANEPVRAEGEITQILDDTFWLTTYYTPFYDFEIADIRTQMADIKAMGLNLLLHPSFYLVAPNNQIPFLVSEEDWLEFDKLAVEFDIYYYYSGSYFTGLPTIDRIPQMVSVAKKLKNCIGYHVYDEPSYAKMEEVGEIVKEFRKYDKEREIYVNLFGAYLSETTLGGTYENYLQHWCDSADSSFKYLSYDYYPFNTQTTNTSQYFENLELCRKVALRNGVSSASCIQTGNWNTFMRVPDEGDYRWQTTTSVAYGQKMLVDFCYLTPIWQSLEDGGEAFKDHILLRDGTKTDLYYQAQKVNQDLIAWGKVLADLECLGAYHSKFYQGAQLIPSDFIVEPNGDSDVIISYLENQKEGADHLMIVNNSWENKFTETFTIDPVFSGIEELWLLNTKTGEYEKAEIIDGKLTLTFEAGEGHLFKIVGDANISFELNDPKVSHPTGEYAMPQYVTVEAGSEKEKIYYTLDGSYPTTDSTLYTGPIKIGEDGKNGEYTLRVVSASGKNLSTAQTYYYYIIARPTNIALGRVPSFSTNYKGYNFLKTMDIMKLTDGVVDLDYAIEGEKGKHTWLTLDMGASYAASSVELSFMDGVQFEDVIVQFSNDKSFATNVTTVYNSDRDNTMGYGRGTDVYLPTQNGEMMEISFDSVSARYMRVTNYADHKSLFSEVAVYNRVNYGIPIANTADNYQVNDGTWSFGEEISVMASESYLDSATYTKQTYKDLVINADISFTGSGDRYVGFELRKAKITDDEETIGGTGVTVAIDGSGKISVLKNLVSYGSGQVENFQPNAVNHIMIVAVGNFVSVWVNDENVMSTTAKALIADGEGYVALHSGGCAAKFDNIVLSAQQYDCVLDTPSTVALLKTLEGEYSLRFTVHKYAHISEVLAALPKTMIAVDSQNVSHIVPMTWSYEQFDSTLDGTMYNFTGEITSLPEGVKNVNNLKVVATVFIKYIHDFTLLNRCIEKVEALKESDFEAAGWVLLQQELAAAYASYTDEYISPSNVTVMYRNLRQAYEALVLKGVDKTDLQVLANRTVQENEYTQVSVAAYKSALDSANAVLQNNFAKASEVKAAEDLLKSCYNGLLKKGDKQALTATYSRLVAMDRSAFTGSSLATLDNALQMVGTALLGEMTETSVELYTALLGNAENSLVRKA